MIASILSLMLLVTAPVVSSDISNTKVNCIEEDSKGYIWIGTFRGLNRYNGYDYRQYFFDQSEESICDNQIKSLYRDRSGRLWDGTVNGPCYHTDNDRFHSPAFEAANRQVLQIFEDRFGAVYIGNGSEYFRYDETADRFSMIYSAAGKDFGYQTSAFVSPENELWVVGQNRLARVSLVTMEERESLVFKDNASYFNFDSSSGRLYVSHYGRTDIFDIRTGKMLSETISGRELSTATVKEVTPWEGDALLLSTEKHGIYIYNNGIVTPETSSDFPFRTPKYQVNTVYRDSRGNIWIGYLDQGIEVISALSGTFQNQHLSQLLGPRSVTSVSCDARGNLYIATLVDGLYIYNLSSGDFRHVDISRIVGYPDHFKSDIGGLMVDSKDHLWACTTFEIFEFAPGGPEGLRLVSRTSSFGAMSIVEGSDGSIYASTAAGLFQALRGPAAGKSLAPFVTEGIHFAPGLVEEERGRFLMTAFNALPYWVNTATFEAHEAEIDPQSWKDAISVSVFIPTDMVRDRFGNYYIGTVANGLMKYSPSGRTVTPIAGLPCSDVCAIEDDGMGCLWISTMHGLCCYNTISGSLRNYFKESGLAGNQFYERSSCRTPDGKIVFGGTHGVTIFDPLKMSATPLLPVNLESFKHRDGDADFSPKGKIRGVFEDGGSITLPYTYNSFTITYAALDYGEAHSVQYCYRLLGYENSWTEAGIRREASFNRLPPGRYVFEVGISGEVAPESLTSLEIIVRTPPYRSWWAILLYVIAGLALLFGTVRYAWIREQSSIALSRAEKEKEQEKTVNRMNMNFFANVAHEFRTPLTMISGPIGQLLDSPDITAHDRKLLDIARRNVRRMLRLVNQMLDFNKLENDTMKLKVRSTDITAQLSYIADIFRVSCEEKGISFVVKGIESPLVVWADLDKMDNICWNLLSNAIKFTPAGGKIEFSLDLDGKDFFPEGDDSQYLRITVRDSGPGIPAEDLTKVFDRYYQLEKSGLSKGIKNYGSGIGLFYAKSLVEMHHGKIWVSQPDGGGSQFSFVLPIHEYAYAEAEKARQEEKLVVSQSVQYSPSEVEMSSEKKTILVVDDDMDVAYYLREMLSREYNVVTRFDAESALAAFQEGIAPDLVLSDVVMTGMSGFTLCRKIKDDIELSHIPVVLLTAKATMENQIEGLKCGADAIVAKPFEPEYLMTLLATTLSNRSKLQRKLRESTQGESLESMDISPKDKAFAAALYELMEKELANSEIDIARMTEMLHISRTKFYYKVKGLTGENPASFFKRYKLNRAAELIREGKYTISEIADMTGFSTPAHFSTSFKKHFGVSPSQYT